MKRASGLRLHEQHLEPRRAPPRSRITVAACRGVATAPAVFSSSPGPGRSSPATSIGASLGAGRGA